MNILLTSVGRRSYMVRYFKEALLGYGEVHAANSVKTYAMTIADKSVIMPLIYDKNYIDFLLNYCLENNIKAIISLFDIDLPILAKNKKKFAEEGILIIVSDYNFVKICNDKWLTYKYLRDNDFYTPNTFLSIHSFFIAYRKGLVHYPLIIKPRWGMGSVGIFQADNYKELKVLYNKTLNSIYSSYLRFESKQDQINNIIIQEKLLGEEYGVDVFNNLDGNFLTSVPKKKLEMRAGETDSAEIIINKDLSEIGKRLGEISKHIGNLDVDCFYENDKFYLVEMNCRFGGQYPFCHLAGVNFPKAILKMIRNEKIEENLLIAKTGTIGVKDINPAILH